MAKIIAMRGLVCNDCIKQTLEDQIEQGKNEFQRVE